MTETILRPFRTDDTAWVVRAHGVSYARDEGFDDSFGELVAAILADFNANHDPAREAGWIAERNGDRVGCIFCVSAGASTAKLRMFLLTPSARGQGLGRRMLKTCTDVARDHGYGDMTLWTHESHRAACALYAATGWQLMDSRPVRSFGVDLVEQTWTITL